ncbi:hypothetical protein VZT92_002821 [Zoarces viviparus]|uniref:Uncharacterized protein n=1 Tax=Zoarces viviparus TaxID=48416 RepID=A0AAW1FZK1_ZOAVI
MAAVNHNECRLRKTPTKKSIQDGDICVASSKKLVAEERLSERERFLLQHMVLLLVPVGSLSPMIVVVIID